MTYWLIIAAAAAGAAPGAEMPARGTAGFDIQCLIAAQQAADQVEGETKDQLGLATMYFFGRTDSDLHNDDALKEQLRASGKLLEGHDLSPILKRCGQYMGERGQVMVNIGRALESEESVAKAK